MKNKLKTFIKKPITSLIFFLNNRKIVLIKNDEKFLKMRGNINDMKINIAQPRSFSEKLQWLKLHNRKPEYTTMVDKIAVKDYVAKKIGEEYIIPTIGVYEKFDDIDFNKLPKQFVMKCNHDSGGLIICKDKTKLDIKAAKKKINKSLKRNYYYTGREWPYKNVKPKIIIEQYMEDTESAELMDYKFYCFNGEPKYCQVIADRSTNETIDFYDMDWVHQPFTGLGLPLKPFAKKLHDMPKTFELMKKSAKKLAKGIPFVRIDFYEINGKMYFGEITFYPASGFGKFSPDEWNKKLGDMIDLSLVKDNNEK